VRNDLSADIVSQVQGSVDAAAASATAAAASSATATSAAGTATSAATSAGNSATAAAASALSVDAANIIHKTGDETKDGVLTFSSSPIVPTATTATQAANKGQLDTVATAAAAAQSTADAALPKSGGTMTGLLKLAKGADIASTATVNLSTATGNTVTITGTTGIAAWTMISGQEMDVVFAGALTLTHHATSNNLPYGANITTVPGMSARLYYDGTTVFMRGFSPTVQPYAYIRDEKTTGTAGGSATAGWQTRTLNTKVTDISGVVTLASNQMVLAAGGWRVKARAPGFRTEGFRIRLRNVTAGTTILAGSNGYSGVSPDAVQTDTHLSGRFVIAAGQTLELQQYCTLASASAGLGAAVADGEVGIYAEIELWKEY
jgi:hypothetical protein